MRIRTGFERVIPQKTSRAFVGKMSQDGKIIKVDEQLKMITVQYDDGTLDVFEYGDMRGDASGMAVNHSIAKHPNVAVGVKVKRGTILTYHDQFFRLDPITNQVSWCHGVPTNIAIMSKDVTHEDSDMISSKLAEKLAFESIDARPITVSTDMVIIDSVSVGSKVAYNDTLMRLKYEDTADIIGDVDELFDDLKQIDYRSKSEGEVVGIEVFHVNDVLNDSLTKFINKVSYRSRRKAVATKGTRQEASYSNVTLVRDGTRVRGVQLSATDVLIVFHIKSKIACGIGDKICCGNSLKSVVGRVENQPMITEEGEEVDMVFSAASIQNRIVLSPIITGIMTNILKAAEKDVLKMYFEESITPT